MLLSKKSLTTGRRGYFSPPVVIILALITLTVAAVIYFNRGLILKSKSGQPASTPVTQQSPQVSPSSSPDAGREPNGSAETANWKTYTNNQLEFRYPSNWRTQLSPQSEIELVDQSSDLVISINVFDPRVVGITYCQAYPKDEPRCELLKVGDVFASIDWGIDNKAGAVVDNLNVVLHKVTPETKILFRQILSTFQFLQ